MSGTVSGMTLPSPSGLDLHLSAVSHIPNWAGAFLKLDSCERQRPLCE
jgi:hypothetical protein